MYLIDRVILRYPADAVKAGVTGSVRILVDIAPDGRGCDGKILSAIPPGVFDQAAIDAAKQATFKVQAEHRKTGLQGWL